MKAEKVISWVVLIVLIAGAFLYGAYREWNGRSREVDVCRAALKEAYTARREAAYNLLTVAKRHLNGENEAVLAVQEDWRQLGETALSAASRGSQALTGDAQNLFAAVQETESLQTDERDKAYILQLLPQMMESAGIRVSSEEAAYREAADDYNASFDKYFISSFLATLFGMDRAPGLS